MDHLARGGRALFLWIRQWRFQQPPKPASLRLPLLLFIAAVLPRFGFLAANGMQLVPDSFGRYLPIGISLFHSWRGSIYDTPGYPLFIYLTAGLSGSVIFLAVAQILLSGVTTVMTWSLGRHAGLGKWALAPAVYLIFNPIDMVFPSTALSETLFAFLVTGSIWAWARIHPKSGPLDFAVLGLFVAGATLTRANGLLFVVMFSLMLPFLCAGRFPLRAPLAFFLATLLPIGAWITINYKIQHLPRIAMGANWQLLQAVAWFDLLDPETLPEQDRPFYKDWTSLNAIRGRRTHHEPDRRQHIALEHQFGRIARENIRRNPTGYWHAVLASFQMRRKEVVDFSRAPLKPPIWEHNRKLAVQYGYPQGRPADPDRPFNRIYKQLQFLSFRGKYAWLLLLGLPILIPALRRKDPFLLAMGVVPAATAVVLALMLNTIDRYYVPFEPLLIISICFSLKLLWDKCRPAATPEPRPEPRPELRPMPEHPDSAMPIPTGSGRGLIIMPAYNEAESLSTLIARCQSLAGWDMLVVNDGSTDETAKVLDDLKVPHLDLPVNLGIGGAMQAGYRYAWQQGYDCAAQIDGDGQHDPAQLDLLRPYLAAADCVIGSRFIQRNGYTSTFTRQMGIGLISLVLRLCTGKQIKDVTSGMRLVNRKVLRLFDFYYPTDYPEPETLAMLLRAGYRVREVGVTMAARQGGVSSITGYKTVLYMVQVIPKIFLSTLIRRYPWHA